MKERKKKGGAKLGRTEVIQVRFDQQLRFATEIAARAEKRTLSSYIELTVSKSLQTIPADLFVEDSFNIDRKTQGSVTIAEVAKKVWDADEVQRFLNLARFAPNLMSPEESFRWDFIKKERSYWRKRINTEEQVVFKKFVKAMWPHLIEVVDEDDYDWDLHADTLESVARKAPNDKLEAYKKLVKELRDYYDED